jgi:hypothetical protein
MDEKQSNNCIHEYTERFLKENAFFPLIQNKFRFHSVRNLKTLSQRFVAKNHTHIKGLKSFLTPATALVARFLNQKTQF